jgi:hypothetical protein
MEESLTINGIEYIPKSSVKQPLDEAKKLKGLKYVIVRTYSAGVFAGYLKEQNGKEGKLLHSRRLWYWDGAASLSQLATDGVSKPQNCKFPCEIEGEHILTEIIEVIPCTEKARLNINQVPIWKK